MREIKFRAWDSILKEYGPDGLFVSFSMFGEVMTFDMIGMRIAETMDKRPHLDGVNLLGRNDFILEQFTGLKDVNGMDIYEGDIVRTRWVWGRDEGPRCYQTIVVKQLFDHESCKAGWNLFCAGPNAMVVIGNIHENAELTT